MDGSVTHHDRKGTGKGTGNMERIFVVEIQDQVQSVEREVISPDAAWLLILAGLSIDVPRQASERRRRPAKGSLALEVDHLNGWFDKFIREDENGCWIWHGARFRNGYGACGFRGTSTVAHRAVWQAMYADLPRNVDLDHLCRVRACVNPDHLEPVTRSTNLTRGAHPTQGRLGRSAA